MAMVRARPPKPRCKAAACWEGVMLPVVTLVQACTSRTNSRKRYLTGRVAMGAGRYCVVSATHMSYRAPDSDP
eukprot:3325700-Pyramimonas_sp.AAC.1